MSRSLRPVEDDLSTDELFARVLEGDEEAAHAALITLHGRPTDLVIRRCRDLVATDEPNDQVVGLTIAAELRHPHVDPDTVWAELAVTVHDVVSSTADPAVLHAGLRCIGYHPSGSIGREALLAHRTHVEADVRRVVAYLLPGFVGTGDDDSVVAALVILTDDPDPDTRAYALMGLVDDLGRLEASTDLLSAHRHDPDPQIRRLVRERLGPQV